MLLQISALTPRIAPSRSKPVIADSSSLNGKITLSKVRPATAPLLKTTIINTQSRTQRLIPLIPPPIAKVRAKPPISSNRRSSVGLISNLQRQSTSTGGSTSSLSSTNTQASIPCIHSETPPSTSSSSTTTVIPILRSVSNDIISSPNLSNINSKSRIPIRAIPIAIVKKSMT
jgi:hypothetical protein